MKKLMVLGAGAPQVCLLEAAKRLGYRTVVCSIDGNYPGFSHADETAYYDISDPEQVLQAAREFHVDGIATCCLDTGVRALGYACQKLGFPGLTEEAAIRSADKWQMKQAFRDAGVNSARFIQVSDRAGLDAALADLPLPVVVKAVDQQGSRGVFICRTVREAEAAYEEAMRITRREYCIVEEFISGNELGAQAFVYQGRIVFILPHGDNTYMSKTAVPIGHYVPLEAPDEVLTAAAAESEKAIRAIGLDNCAVNIDLIERDGKVYVIELTGRAGATCLPELVSIWYGVDYYEMIAAMAMGEDPIALFERRSGKLTPNASRMLLSEVSGTVKRIDNPYTVGGDIYDLSLLIREGDTVNKFTNAKDRIGQVIVRGDTLQGCLDRVDEILAGLKIEVE